MMDWLEPLTPLAVALVGAAVLTPVCMGVARSTGAVDRPKSDRWHRSETPLLGGVAIVGGLLLALLLVGGVQREILAVVGGVVMLFAVGLVDDLRGLRPSTKLVAQTAAAGVLILGGVRAGWPEDPLLSMPLTVVWVVGVTNAVNLLDNMDGLAAGIVGISAVAIGLCSAALPPGVGELSMLVALAVGGAALGFLPFNRSPARIFMGDAGSLPLGFALAAATLLGTHREAGRLAFVIAGPLLTMAVPILDTVTVSVLRKWHGREISAGGLDHLSHRLVALGVPERRAVTILWGMAAVFGAFAVASTRLEWMGSLVLLVLAVLASAVIGAVLGHAKVYTRVERPAEAQKTEEFRRTALNYGRAVGPIAVDFVLAGVAYVGAYLLRYEGRIPAPELELLVQTLPVVVALQLSVLAAYRVYRGVWRYFGVRDATALARGCVGAGVATALAVVFGWRHEEFSRAVLVIDPALLVLFLFGARAATRFLSDAFGGFPADGVRVLVVGAGEPGELCLRALRARGGAQVTPVGILDDDPSLRRRHIHGVPVLGSTTDLTRVLREFTPEEVVLSTLPDEERVGEIRAVAQDAGARLTLSPYAKAFVPL